MASDRKLPPEAARAKRVPMPKKMPEDHKQRFLRKEEEAKLNEEKMKDLNDRLEKVKQMGSQRPSEPVDGPQKRDLSKVNAQWLLTSDEGPRKVRCPFWIL